MTHRIAGLLALSAVVASSGSLSAEAVRRPARAAAYLASPQALADLGRINDQFIENFIRNDVAAHDALLHPSFIHVTADGTRQDRTSYLRDWATGFDPDVVLYWDVRDEAITLVGNVALVRSTNKQIVRRSGTERTGMSTYTDTYIYQNGRWRCIQAQITRVAPGKEPPDSTIKTVYLRGVRQ